MLQLSYTYTARSANLSRSLLPSYNLADTLLSSHKTAENSLHFITENSNEFSLKDTSISETLPTEMQQKLILTILISCYVHFSIMFLYSIVVIYISAFYVTLQNRFNNSYCGPHSDKWT